MSLRRCTDFIRVTVTVRNRRILAIHGSNAPFSHIVCENCYTFYKNPTASKLHLNLQESPLSNPVTSSPSQTQLLYTTIAQSRHHTSKGAMRPTLNHASHPTTKSEGATRPTQEVKTPRGGGLGVVVWFN